MFDFSIIVSNKFVKKQFNLLFALFILIFLSRLVFSQVILNEAVHEVIFENNAILKSSDYKNQFKLNAEYNLSINADFEIAYIWIYNDQGFDFFDVVEQTSYTTIVPEGKCFFILGNNISTFSHTIINRGNIFISSDSIVYIKQTEASVSNTYSFNKPDNDLLEITTFSIYLYNSITKSNLRISFRNIDVTFFGLYHNNILPHIEGEWALKSKQLSNNGDLYLLSNKFEAPDSNTLITNDPNNLVYADFYYHFPDSLIGNMYGQIFTFFPDFHSKGSKDPYYTIPMVQRIYQDTILTDSYKSSKFFQGFFANNYQSFSPEIRIGKDKVKGYHFRDTLGAPFILSETKEVQIGIMPTFWYGKFINKVDSIKIRSPYGMRLYPFLSIGNDLLPHYPFYYSLYRNEIIVDSGNVTLILQPNALQLGFNPSDLTLSSESDKYRYIISDSQNEVAGMQSKTTLIAEFDLRLEDKNPPNILSYQILSNNILTNSLMSDNNNLVRFIADDNESIKTVTVFIKTLNGDSIWNKKEVLKASKYYYSILGGLSTGYYSLKTVLSDSSGNIIDMTIEPAFHVDQSLSIPATLLSNENLILKNAYPNPFNSKTTISFYIPIKFSSKISLNVYNVNGQKIITLYNGYPKSGLNTIIWDTNENQKYPISSGIYFLVLKGGDIQQTKKILLVK